jgi:hypothetical protein
MSGISILTDIASVQYTCFRAFSIFPLSSIVLYSAIDSSFFTLTVPSRVFHSSPSTTTLFLYTFLSQEKTPESPISQEAHVSVTALYH